MSALNLDSIGQSADYGLNAVNFDLWNAMQNPVSITALRNHVTEIFDFYPVACQSNVVELLTALREYNLVQLAG